MDQHSQQRKAPTLDYWNTSGEKERAHSERQYGKANRLGNNEIVEKRPTMIAVL